MHSIYNKRIVCTDVIETLLTISSVKVYTIYCIYFILLFPLEVWIQTLPLMLQWIH